ncbi:hypothetical protein RSOLAG1IB_03631 [Rhizoctonia solani AG-1 IB]|uniref:Ricin B lectin domain-containing protein n=1 Tax=Thanatephorus cucumeris (strain AG1-IB / isolate 7/3/14) TaxID=1108050 RepID=A0A0B7FTZ7_THACB|nr:hypothetical protein RSOLAG1IB_03631 [Rhizoctonia solani AG-1 IB]
MSVKPPVPYEDPPKPGAYFIANRAVPKNYIEIHPDNQRRAVCSPDAPVPRQMWYIQRFGKGYKIKNAKYADHVESDEDHDGFAIQYGEEDGVIDLYCGHTEPASALYIAKLDSCNHASRRWHFLCKSNDVGEEMAETIEDQIADLQSQIARKDEELSQQERELNESRETLAEILSMWCMYEKLNMLD